MPAKWIADIIRGQTCTRCERPLGADDVWAVGIRMPDRNDLCVPTYNVIFECAVCQTQFAAGVTGISFRDFCDGAYALHQTIISEMKPNDHPLFGASTSDTQTIAPEDDPDKNTDIGSYRGMSRRRIRPSRRPGHPRKPITDSEFRKFLRLLQRTSLKVRSKSLERFLERLRGR